MAGGTRQRRGKKGASGPTTSGEASTAGNPPSGSKSSSGSQGGGIDSGLRQVMAKIAMTNTRTMQLHEMWRGALLKMSFLVVLLSLHQSNSYVRTCIYDVKRFNEEAVGNLNDDLKIGGFETVGIVVSDAISALVGIFVSSLLFTFLSHKGPAPARFASPYYMISTAMVPVCIILHFQQGNRAEPAYGGKGDATIASCLAGHEHFDAGIMFGGDDADELSARPKKQLAVAVVFHTLVTISFWFMARGRDHSKRNMEMLEQLEKELGVKKNNVGFKAGEGTKATSKKSK